MPDRRSGAPRDDAMPHAAARSGAAPASDASAVVELEAVRFAWDDRAGPVVDIDAFAVARGERVFVRGASGSGKTTLLGLIAAVLLPDAGRVEVDGVRVDALAGAARDRFRAERLGVVFQQFNLLPFLSVVENVTLPCRFSARRRARATEGGGGVDAEARRLLGALRLPPGSIDGRQALALSVGQQQRVALARALIGRPALLIADEPTSALDADTRDAFVELLFAEAEAAGSTVLFVSHDRALARHFDRAVDLEAINRAARPAELA